MRNCKTSDIVFNKIVEKILGGEWKPGDKIMSEHQLVKELNISRVSVREAIEKMVTLDLLYKRQGGGTYVNNLQPSIYLNNLIPMTILGDLNYKQILEFKLIMEVESVKLCAERCTIEDVKDLEGIYEYMLVLKNDNNKFIEANLNFHMKIAHGSENTIIIKVNEILIELMKYYEKCLFKSIKPKEVTRDHKFILEAIKNRDSELAGLLMKRHIERYINN